MKVLEGRNVPHTCVCLISSIPSRAHEIRTQYYSLSNIGANGLEYTEYRNWKRPSNSSPSIFHTTGEETETQRSERGCTHRVLTWVFLLHKLYHVQWERTELLCRDRTNHVTFLWKHIGFFVHGLPESSPLENYCKHILKDQTQFRVRIFASTDQTTASLRADRSGDVQLPALPPCSPNEPGICAGLLPSFVQRMGLGGSWLHLAPVMGQDGSKAKPIGLI